MASPHHAKPGPTSSAPPASPPAAAGAVDGDLKALTMPAAVDGNVEVPPPPPASRPRAGRTWSRPLRYAMRSLRSVLSGVARAGGIVGGAYRRSSALCAHCYERSAVPGYVAKSFALCARLWDAAGVVFNPLPDDFEVLPVTDPSLAVDRLFFTPNMERIELLFLAVFAAGAALFVSLERLLTALRNASEFYNNFEWLRIELTRERLQLPPPVDGKQQLPLMLATSCSSHRLPPSSTSSFLRLSSTSSLLRLLRLPRISCSHFLLCHQRWTYVSLLRQRKRKVLRKMDKAAYCIQLLSSTCIHLSSGHLQSLPWRCTNKATRQ